MCPTQFVANYYKTDLIYTVNTQYASLPNNISEKGNYLQ